MKPRPVKYAPESKRDIAQIWELIAVKDGAERADRTTAKITAFCLSLANVPNIGTRHPERHPGLRSSGIPGLKKAAVLFLVTPTQVVVVRVGYLGRNVWASVPLPSNDNEND